MTVTVTSVLDEIWADGLLPSLSAAFPWIGTMLNIPIIGGLLTDIINGGADWMIKNGVIAGKEVILNVLDSASQAKWAAQIEIVKSASAGGLTPAQQQDYDNALQNLVNSHGGVVSA